MLVVGATNRPQELDEAARRRFVKKLYIPLPEPIGRKDLLTRLLAKNRSTVSTAQVDEIVERTDGYSGADMKNLCTEAAMGPMRDLGDALYGMQEQVIRAGVLVCHIRFTKCPLTHPPPNPPDHTRKFPTSHSAISKRHLEPCVRASPSPILGCTCPGMSSSGHFS